MIVLFYARLTELNTISNTFLLLKLYMQIWTVSKIGSFLIKFFTFLMLIFYSFTVNYLSKNIKDQKLKHLYSFCVFFWIVHLYAYSTVLKERTWCKFVRALQSKGTVLVVNFSTLRTAVVAVGHWASHLDQGTRQTVIIP